jgi:thioredoxin reductase
MLIVGSGPGGMQLSYCLTRLGVEHAVISADDAPGGMFRRWPLFQRLLSWTKPHAPAASGTALYERYDWNSLLADEDQDRGLQAGLMDGTSYFPSRPEMQRNLETFAQRTRLRVRHGCRWEATRREGEDFVLATSDGEYRCRTAVFAVGVAEPWRPSTPGLELVPHYGEMQDAEAYAGRRVFIVGKKNSAFEIASGLLPWARGIVLASPSPARTSLETRNLMGVRARYAQPFEDSHLGGGVVVLDAAIDEVARSGDGYRVRVHRSDSGLEMSFDVDDVIAATGFQTPLLDLPEMGVTTVGQSRLPVQTPFWESADVPGTYFAGTISQGAGGLKKHGIAANSGAVHGARYNARVLARHLAETRHGVVAERPRLRAGEVGGFLLSELDGRPDLFHQRSYLARCVRVTPGEGIVDEGILPLTHFLDGTGYDGVAVTLEANPAAEIYPALYVRRGGQMKEHLLDTNKLVRFDGDEYRRAVDSILEPLLA